MVETTLLFKPLKQFWEVGKIANISTWFVSVIHMWYYDLINRSRMEQEDVSVHYSDVAGHYDDMYGFTNNYTAEFAVKHLQLKPDDRLVDIGAGTGQISSLIWKKAGLAESKIYHVIARNFHLAKIWYPSPPFLWVKFYPTTESLKLAWWWIYRSCRYM